MFNKERNAAISSHFRSAHPLPMPNQLTKSEAAPDPHPNRTPSTTAPSDAITTRLLPTSRTRRPAEIGTAVPVIVASMVSSMSVVSGTGPGVDSVSTPHATSAAANVLVQTVSVGPVRGPSRWWEPTDVDPVQVAAVFPSSLHSRSAVLG